MKKFLGAIATIAVLTVPAFISFADSDDLETSGSVLLDNTVQATATESAGGGTWSHWMTTDTVYSHYNHPSKSHAASTQNSKAKHDSGWYSKGNLAPSSIARTVSGNKANWRTK